MAKAVIPELVDGFSPLRVGKLTAVQKSLWSVLPADYRSFLRNSNGGIARDFQYSFRTGVPWQVEEKHEKSTVDCVRECFGFKPKKSRAAKPQDLLATFVDYSAEAFLPRDFVPIACCHSSSLVCISARGDTYGTLWYWDWYWRYPWRGDFYERRIQRARKGLGRKLAALEDPWSDDYQSVVDALNFATVVKLADSFDGWLAMLYDARDELKDA